MTATAERVCAVCETALGAVPRHQKICGKKECRDELARRRKAARVPTEHEHIYAIANKNGTKRYRVDMVTKAGRKTTQTLDTIEEALAVRERELQRQRETRPERQCPYCHDWFQPVVSTQKMCGKRECVREYDRERRQSKTTEPTEVEGIRLLHQPTGDRFVVAVGGDKKLAKTWEQAVKMRQDYLNKLACHCLICGKKFNARGAVQVTCGSPNCKRARSRQLALWEHK